MQYNDFFALFVSLESVFHDVGQEFGKKEFEADACAFRVTAGADFAHGHLDAVINMQVIRGDEVDDFPIPQAGLFPQGENRAVILLVPVACIGERFVETGGQRPDGSGSSL